MQGNERRTRARHADCANTRFACCDAMQNGHLRHVVPQAAVS
ncbi:hypothetical protein ACS15_5334 [Ralstonia insidiosa]|uniref:Uncharacterized protein n=1 Tax=Ralstonia insidiosa TaxID=190721 RepID=A0AAC9FV72_9RALS|nr:hypothetical protein ACS15_5334 [Ralstonia insidiosa]